MLPGRSSKGAAMPRPIELDESLFEALAQELRDGADNGSAAAMLGVTCRTFRRWKARGEQDFEAGEDTPYARLWQVFVRARGKAQGSASKRVFKENPLAWLTKGPGQEEWSDRQIVDAHVQADVTADVQQRVMVDVRMPSDFPEGSEWRNNYDKALAWMQENDWLVVDESDEDEEQEGESNG